MLSVAEVNKNKELFISLVKDNITRKGVDKLLEHLEKETDFFTAPCSTKFHLNYRGGLCEHSINVFTAICCLATIDNEQMLEDKSVMESLAIIALFHDLCKADYYEVNPSTYGKAAPYIVNDQFPCGHGEKSVIEIMQFMRLKREEILAIRWHMGAWDEAVKGGSYAYNTAQDSTILVPLLHIADMYASQVTERVK